MADRLEESAGRSRLGCRREEIPGPDGGIWRGQRGGESAAQRLEVIDMPNALAHDGVSAMVTELPFQA